MQVRIDRVQGKPLIYAINRLTLGLEKFAMLAAVVGGLIEADKIHMRLEAAEWNQLRIREARMASRAIRENKKRLARAPIL